MTLLNVQWYAPNFFQFLFLFQIDNINTAAFNLTQENTPYSLHAPQDEIQVALREL